MRTNKKISFDYDGTLDDHFNGIVNENKLSVQQLLAELIEEGCDVYIITRRFGPENFESQKVFELLKTLNIPLSKEKIIFTNRAYKHLTIQNLKIDIHIDDDIVERELIDKFTMGHSVDASIQDWRIQFDKLL